MEQAVSLTSKPQAGFDWDEFTRSQSPARYQEPPQFNREEQFTEYLVSRLSSAFEIHARPQLQGRTCTGRKVCADLILQPRRPWGGRDGVSHAPVILEVKRSFHIEAVSKAIGQAMDYAHATWDTSRLAHKGWTDLPPDGRMVACVVLGTEDHAMEGNGMFMVERIAGRANVMTLSHSKWTGWTIKQSGNRQWSEEHGMANTKYRPHVREGSR